MILQRDISHEELKKLLNDGQTELLEGFISKRTKRPFKAYLVFDSRKKAVGFKFEPRESGKKGATAAEAKS